MLRDWQTPTAHVRHRPLPEKVWERHVVHAGATGEPDLLYIDLHLVHEVTSPQAFDGLRLAGRRVRRPELTVATEDHNVPTADIDQPIADPISARQVEALRDNTAEFGITHYPMGDPGQGIVHVIGPEQGRTLPGMTIVCGDSHTGDPRRVRRAGVRHRHERGRARAGHADAAAGAAEVDGGRRSTATLPAGVTAKDIILAIIGEIGTGGGIGHVIEYRGSAIRALSMEGRMTVCNMSIEAGAKAGLVAPDDTTFDYLEGRAHAPQRRGVGRGARRLAHAAHRRRRGVGQARSSSTPPTLRAAGHVGHQPRSGRARSTVASRRPTTSPMPTTRETRRPGARVHGPQRRARRSATSPSTRCSSARARTAGSRTCAPPPRCSTGRHVTAKRVMVVPGSHAVKAQAEAEGLRPRSSPPPAPTGASPAARCAWR